MIVVSMLRNGLRLSSTPIVLKDDLFPRFSLKNYRGASSNTLRTVNGVAVGHSHPILIRWTQRTGAQRVWQGVMTKS